MCQLGPVRHVLALLCLFGVTGQAKEPEKLVIAHYMTDMVPMTDRPLSPWIDPELADPEGSTAALGGLHQTVPMASLHLKNASLTEAVDFEIRAARQLGVDGFQFYYPLGDNSRLLTQFYNRTIREFIRLSETRYPGFRVSICLAHPHTEKPLREDGKIELWSEPVRALLDGIADSPAWLRSENGALLFYLWSADRIADGVIHIAKTPDQIGQVGAAYRTFSKTVGVPIDYVYQVRHFQSDSAYVDAITKNFAAVWGWTASDENTAFWELLAKRCRDNNCWFTQTVYPDYYTSKVYRKGSEDYRFLPVAEALALGEDAIERHYRVTNLSQTQIHLLQQAVKRNVPIINYATWNDYPEGHHLAPEVHRNFGPALLLRHFKEQWKTGESAVVRDEAIVFFKKHRHDAAPKHAITLKIESRNKNLAGEDRIELVTLLTEPAECFLNGRPLGTVAAGLRVNSIPNEPGPVRVRIERHGKPALDFETPAEITAHPIRTDRLTYSWSSAFDREFERLFGTGESPED